MCVHDIKLLVPFSVSSEKMECQNGFDTPFISSPLSRHCLQEHTSNFLIRIFYCNDFAPNSWIIEICVN